MKITSKISVTLRFCKNSCVGTSISKVSVSLHYFHWLRLKMRAFHWLHGIYLGDFDWMIRFQRETGLDRIIVEDIHWILVFLCHFYPARTLRMETWRPDSDVNKTQFDWLRFNIMYFDWTKIRVLIG